MCAVEWKCLNEIANVTIGEFVHKDKQNPNAEYPVYNGGISNTGYYEDFNNTGNKIIISARGANAGYINRVFVNYWAGNSCYSISVTSNDVDWNFLFYFLKTNQQKLIGEQQKGGIPAISKKQICTFEIPIPSLAKQQEIVSHLDTFTTLISNLESELDMRRKQYEHYRNQLLDFEGQEGVEWKTLGEVAINRDRMRKPITASKRVAGIYPYYGASGIVDYVEGYIFDGNYLLISEDGANLIARSTPIAFPISGKTWVNNHAHVLEFNNLITQRLIEIYLNSIDLTKYISGGAQPKLNQENLNSILIPIPSLATQQEIVEKLDAFENLIQSLEQEIKLRKQQYEYYREKLLTFEKE